MYAAMRCSFVSDYTSSLWLVNSQQITVQNNSARLHNLFVAPGKAIADHTSITEAAIKAMFGMLCQLICISSGWSVMQHMQAVIDIRLLTPSLLFSWIPNIPYDNVSMLAIHPLQHALS